MFHVSVQLKWPPIFHSALAHSALSRNHNTMHALNSVEWISVFVSKYCTRHWWQPVISAPHKLQNLISIYSAKSNDNHKGIDKPNTKLVHVLSMIKMVSLQLQVLMTSVVCKSMIFLWSRRFFFSSATSHRCSHDANAVCMLQFILTIAFALSRTNKFTIHTRTDERLTESTRCVPNTRTNSYTRTFVFAQQTCLCQRCEKHKIDIRSVLWTQLNLLQFKSLRVTRAWNIIEERRKKNTRSY